MEGFIGMYTLLTYVYIYIERERYRYLYDAVSFVYIYIYIYKGGNCKRGLAWPHKPGDDQGAELVAIQKCTSMYIYIYIYIERERERYTYTHILRSVFKSSIWKNGPSPWEIWAFKRHVEASISNGSGIWDPQFESCTNDNYENWASYIGLVLGLHVMNTRNS